jgi:Eukaryotic aspartyl protease
MFWALKMLLPQLLSASLRVCIGMRSFLHLGIQKLTLAISPRDGIDGSWSTFALQLGTPPQTVRLLPSITGSTMWAVLPQACHESSVSTCGSDRGGIFATNQSTTWEAKGRFYLPLDPEHYLPFSGAGDFGMDNVTLDWQGHGGITLERQIIASYITEDFYVGALGLSPRPVNIASFTDQYPSLLGTLKTGNHISSNAYGYTAGASYRPFGVSAFGSLTLGGYDPTRMDESKNLTIVGGSDTYRPLLLGIEEIKSGMIELLEAPIVAALDSIVSQLWLPLSACKNFESAFGLVWNSTYELYIVNETQHENLLSQNASVTLILSTGSEQNKTDRLDITLPYAAFDLMATPPFAGLNESVHYFPLKQAANETQYTLGRTFLQEVYMIADYDRAALSLFPAVFPDSGTETLLISIESPDDTGANVDSETNLSRAGITGIVVGTVILIVLLAAGAWFYSCRNRFKKVKEAAFEKVGPWEKAELGGDRTYHRSELEGRTVNDTRHELGTSMGTGSCQGLQSSSALRSPPQEMCNHDGADPFTQEQIHELS